MQNLLSNAHRYGGGTPVEVNVRAGTPGNVVFTVSDRGGIPEAETRAQIFEPFYRAKDGDPLYAARTFEKLRRHGAFDASDRCLVEGTDTIRAEKRFSSMFGGITASNALARRPPLKDNERGLSR